MTKKLLLTLAMIFSTSSALADAPLICSGVDKQGDSYTVYLDEDLEGNITAAIDQSWAAGEELDSDSFAVRAAVKERQIIYSQSGASEKQMVEGFKLTMKTTGSQFTGRLRLKVTPAGNNSAGVIVPVTCGR